MEGPDYWGGPVEPVLTTIGDIALSPHWVHTPSGTYPLRGSVWTVTDMSHYENISTTGVVLCIVFVWLCLLGLLFLLMKDRRMVGYIQITVQGNGFYHSTMVRPTGPQSILAAQQVVNYARSLAASA